LAKALSYRHHPKLVHVRGESKTNSQENFPQSRTQSLACPDDGDSQTLLVAQPLAERIRSCGELNTAAGGASGDGGILLCSFKGGMSTTAR
ncbi:hypothetical protein Dimus_000839, partial [Dionaea muscipula]